jgi:RNA polymerase sigma-70 factor, ECF subfamily
VIDRARNGDRDAFELIVCARKDAVYRLAIAILGDEADAADAAQDALVAAWRQLRRLRDPARFDAWLQRTVVNAARQVIRSNRRRRAREVPASSLVALSGTPAPAPRNDAAILDAALAMLPVDQRAILVLHHLEHRGLGEIGAILGIPVGTVKSRLFAARRAVAAAITSEARG